ncbi:MAG: hypothetical protein ACJ8FY_15160 [Gemmataceae bacterium]
MTMAVPQSAPAEWDRIQRQALLIGAAGLAVLLAGAFWNLDQFFRAYLVAFTYWLGIGLGCLVILMIQYLTGGAWGVVLRRILESGAVTVAALTIFLVPILLGLPNIYDWAKPEAAAHDPHLEHKRLYLNVPFFLGRAAGYFVIWLVLVYFLTRWSVQQDQTKDPRTWRRFRLLSGPGMVLYGLTITFASIDWAMSIEPDWFSTIYPVLYATSQLLTAMAFAIAILMYLAGRPPMSEVIAPSHLRDLGNLLLTFVMLWAYMQISQFLLIWSGNIPEEIPWYLRRIRGGWEWVALLIVLLHFALPFLLLLSKDVKRNRRTLAAVAVGLMAMRFIDVFWWIEPAYPHEGQYFFWLLDLAAVAGLGGIWICVFFWQLRKQPVLPIYDPSLAETLHHE